MLELWDEFVNRLRDFFRRQGYLEVSTPILLEFPNLDSNIEPISVDVRIRNHTRGLWLQTSPEYSMKKLLSKYGKNIFQLAKVFRNNEFGRLHRIEFHMLEWYRVGESYQYLIEEIKGLLTELFSFEEFEEITFEELFKKTFGRELTTDADRLRDILRERGLNYSYQEDWETLFYRLFLEVERKLGWEKPTFLKDFPRELCALAKLKGAVAERFELFIKGVEIANGWTEETDPVEVRRRLEREAKLRKLPLDEDFVKAHEGMPPCAGCSIGVDRLFMLWLGKDSLEGIEL